MIGCFNLMRGFIFFIVFICKKSVWEMIRKDQPKVANILAFLVEMFRPKRRLQTPPAVTDIQRLFRETAVWWFPSQCFLIWPTPAYFIIYFQSFQTNIITIFTTNIFEKCPSSIRCQDSNPQPSEHESLPITNRPGLLPSIKHSYCVFRVTRLILTN